LQELVDLCEGGGCLQGLEDFARLLEDGVCLARSAGEGEAAALAEEGEPLLGNNPERLPAPSGVRVPLRRGREVAVGLGEPDDRTASTVKRIFELYTSGRLGTAAIARQLAGEEAAAPPAGWQPAVVQLVLQNEAYLGRVLWRGQSMPGLHQPLIDELTFQRAQRLLRERGEDMALRRSNPGDYLLSGLVRCGRCRRAYVGMIARGNGGLYHYYACSGRQKLGRKACDGERIPRDKLETAVLHQLAGLYRDGTLIRDALQAAKAKAHRAQSALEEQRRALADEIRRAERALTRYYTAFEAGDLDATRFEKRVSALETRLDALREQDADLAGQIAPQGATSPEPADLAAVADNLETTIATADPRQAKALLRLLIKHLRVNGRREILPTYRIVTDTVCALPSSVGGTGLEPVTPSLSSWCSPN
jgi:site-specific DNA recombinase